MYFTSLNNKSLALKYAASDNWKEVDRLLEKISEKEILFSDSLTEIALISSIHNKQYDKIFAYMDKLKLNSDSKISLKALSLYTLGLYKEAFSYLDRLANPNIISARILRSNILKKLGRYEEAILAIEEYKTVTSIKVELASLYEIIGENDACLKMISQAHKENPNDKKIEFNYSLQLLKRSNWEKGWSHFESRMSCLPTSYFDYKFPIRINSKEMLEKEVFVDLFCEQGLGDYLQFLRYAKLLQIDKKEVRVFGLGDNALCERGNIQCVNVTIDGNESLPSCSIMSLPYLTGKLEPIRVEASKRLNKGNVKKVGICWAGNPMHPFDYLRSAPLKYFGTLSTLRGISLYSLQQDIRPRKYSPCGETVDLTAECPPFKLHDCGKYLQTMEGTMQIIQQLDLVITVDTAVAHMAANLGIPTWIVISCPYDWRWGMSGDTTPWYDSVKLFRRRYLQSWQDVFASVKDALQSYCFT